MKKNSWFKTLVDRAHTLMLWPLIVAGGQLVSRIFLNLWNIIES